MADHEVDQRVPEGALCREWMGAFSKDCEERATHRVTFKAGTLEKGPVSVFKCDKHVRRFLHTSPMRGATDVQPTVQ